MDQIVTLSPTALEGSVPDPASYDEVSDGWTETEYRADFGNSAVEGGYWTGSAGSVAFESWPYTELCVVLRGRVAVEDESGARREFGAGESFVIPQGFKGVWHTLEDTEKVFMGVHRAQ
ncbi:cupin domain-containing protein [Ruicaihuangia caeni]|uniref:Cupin domain-containing protein n=1 Tax=Ruicaihuangia caeni TaxID=3042517 RepID=A0AAW6T7M8_9MICO|nr:cupin domain-containing protein [Klugiella sp. YN-L-19]MDI2098314.1 cupin domain-containing protein [Klugiella sp. YN-L-19]